MAKYVINEAGPQYAGMPNQNVEVEAESFEERGSFTVFLGSDGEDKLSMKTDKIKSIRRVG